MDFRNKFLSVLLVLVMLFGLSGQIGYAAGESNFTTVVASEDVYFQTNLLAIGRRGGASSMASSSTYIGTGGLAYSVITKFIGGGGGLDSTGIGTVLPDGSPGQVISFIISGVQSGGSWKITPSRATGFISITLDTKGDVATLVYINDTVGWIVQSGFGITVTQN
jgi:hypothetical protein